MPGPGCPFHELLADAWPAREERTVGRWRLRWAWGLTRRANSVLTLGDPVDLAGNVEAAEAFYRDRDLPVRFQVSDQGAPKGLAAYLEHRGYRPEGETLVMAHRFPEAAPAKRAPAGWSVRLSERLDEGWILAYWQYGEDRPEVSPSEAARRLRSTMLAPPLVTTFVAGRFDRDPPRLGPVSPPADRPDVVVQGVVQGRWVGVQCLACRPPLRRRGGSSAAMDRLTRWALDRGAEGMYLAVTARNTPALALYGHLGFARVGSYRYWCRP